MNLKHLERIKIIKKLSRRETQIYRSAGKERVALNNWDRDKDGSVFTDLILTGAAIAGWASKLLVSIDLISEEEIKCMYSDFFQNKLFVEWFLNERHKFPKLTHCFMILEDSRRELIKIIEDEYGITKRPK